MKVASVWCIINLTWLQDSGSAERIQALSGMGVVEALKSISNDHDMDVRERVRTALAHFDSAENSMDIDQ